MRIQLMTLGSRGDVQPYIALGAALKARGHDVTVTTGRGFDDLIEAHGLRATSISDDVRELIEDPLVQEAMKSVSGKIKAWCHFKNEAARQLDESWAITRDIGPDVIVYHVKMAGAPTYAETLGIPAGTFYSRLGRGREALRKKIDAPRGRTLRLVV